jgi:hypothetical protein
MFYAQQPAKEGGPVSLLRPRSAYCSVIFRSGGPVPAKAPVESDGTAAQYRKYWAFLFRVFLFSAVYSIGEFQMLSPERIPFCGALHSVGVSWAASRIKNFFVRPPYGQAHVVVLAYPRI